MEKNLDENYKEPSNIENQFSFEGNFFENNSNEATVILDSKTSCKYLVVSQFHAGYGTSVTPLLKQDGTPDCGAVEL